MHVAFMLDGDEYPAKNWVSAKQFVQAATALRFKKRFYNFGSADAAKRCGVAEALERTQGSRWLGIDTVFGTTGKNGPNFLL